MRSFKEIIHDYRFTEEDHKRLAALQPLMEGHAEEIMSTLSLWFIGTKGALLYPLDSGPLLLPKDRFSGVDRPSLEARNHYHHFVDACLGHGRTECDFLQTGPMTETILLGTVAVRWPDQWLQWDAEHLKIPNCPAAEAGLRRTYRQGWGVA